MRRLPLLRRLARHCSSGAGDDLARIASTIPPDRVRNFCIISHVDHGKSTLADRLMELTGAVGGAGTGQAQLLDSLAVERERGITVKAQTVSLLHAADGDAPHLVNLIDTPGHVDFSYEVSRSIGACEGAFLLVDATKGVQAQTVANFWLAFEQGLTIIPVVNKVDLPHADVDGTLEQMATAFDVERDEALAISAKTGQGCDALLDALVRRVPPPPARADDALRVLLFDSWYDDYRGVLCLVKVVAGSLALGDPLVSAATGSAYKPLQIELMRPLGNVATASLGPGQVGCVALGMKAISEAMIGDCFSAPAAPQPAFAGFRRPQPMVFAGLYPHDESGFEALQHAMGRFLLKDASVRVEAEHSPSLGRGLRCGFLGLLHLDVVQQRLLQEHDVAVLVTAPTVPLVATMVDGTTREVLSPESLPPKEEVESLREPLVRVTLLSPAEYVGPLISLCEERGASDGETSFLGADRAMLRYTLPLAEVATEFHDRVQNLSSGFASVDYEEAGEQEASVSVLKLRVNNEPVEAMSRIVRAHKAHDLGREMVATMKATMSRQVYEIAIQAVVGSKVVARATLKATRKNVLAKCYGGDVSRKKKLLQKQKEGKKRRQLYVGNVVIPHETFVAVLAPGGTDKGAGAKSRT